MCLARAQYVEELNCARWIHGAVNTSQCAMQFVKGHLPGNLPGYVAMADALEHKRRHLPKGARQSLVLQEANHYDPDLTHT